MNAKILKHLRETYRKGTRVQLIKMDDVQAPSVGTKGTVIGVDDIGSVMVSWDNGSSLSLVYGIDSAWIFNTVATVCYGETKVWDSRDEALQYFLEGMTCCEGSESQWYALIYARLKNGSSYATDEY